MQANTPFRGGTHLRGRGGQLRLFYAPFYCSTVCGWRSSHICFCGGPRRYVLNLKIPISDLLSSQLEHLFLSSGLSFRLGHIPQNNVQDCLRQ